MSSPAGPARTRSAFRDTCARKPTSACSIPAREACSAPAAAPARAERTAPAAAPRVREARGGSDLDATNDVPDVPDANDDRSSDANGGTAGSAGTRRRRPARRAAPEPTSGAESLARSRMSAADVYPGRGLLRCRLSRIPDSTAGHRVPLRHAGRHLRIHVALRRRSRLSGRTAVLCGQTAGGWVASCAATCASPPYHVECTKPEHCGTGSRVLRRELPAEPLRQLHVPSELQRVRRSRDVQRGNRLSNGSKLSEQRGHARVQDLPAVISGHKLELGSSSRPRRTPGWVSGSPAARSTSAFPDSPPMRSSVSPTDTTARTSASSSAVA